MKFYYKDGVTSEVLDFSKTLHREDGPAAIYSDGFEWYLNGKLHREDGPAVNGTEPSRRKAVLLQPSLIEDYKLMTVMAGRKDPFEAGKYWYKSGKLHREDGPAIDLKIENWKMYCINDMVIYNKEAYDDIRKGKDLSYYLSSPVQGEREFAEIISGKKEFGKIR